MTMKPLPGAESHDEMTFTEIEDEKQYFVSSFAQESLWFLDQLEADDGTYHLVIALRLKGPLQESILHRSLESMLERHEVLRTTFVAVAGSPMQSIASWTDIELPRLDLSCLDEDERESEAQRLIGQALEMPFDLGKGPLLRAWLLPLTRGDHMLVTIFHHIIMDGWSTELFAGELSTLYTAFVAGEEPQLPALPVQYADYATWQRDVLQEETLEELTTYWRGQLSGAPAILELPTDHPRPAILGHRGRHLTFQLPTPLTAALHDLSQSAGATLFMTLLSAFQILLMRYTGQRDIVVGTPIAGRTRAELTHLIGHFANMLVLRTDLTGATSFLDVLRRVRNICLDAYDHQDMPFECLVEALSPQRSLGYHSLFQVSFGLQNFAVQPLQFTDLEASLVEITRGTAHFDLTCDFLQMPDGLVGRLEYASDLFEDATIERMLGHYLTLLQSIVTNPQQSIATLPLLTDRERQQLLYQWNETHVDDPIAGEFCLADLFEMQARRMPDRIAVVYEQQHVTYRELDEWANRLAWHLRARGVGPDVAVGLCCERSPEMLIGVLGILKAGGCYVPLDATYPAARLAFLMTDARMPVLLTQQHLQVALSTFTGEIICLDTTWHALASYPSSSPFRTVVSGNLAYLIYTSGSTGTPKGVAMPHAALVNLCLWQQRSTADPTAGERTLQFASLSFDVASQEIFSTLGSGHTLVLLSELVRRDPDALLHLLAEQAISRLFLPVVALHQLAEAATLLSRLSLSLREVITAGEQLRITRNVVNLFEHLPACLLINQYGPSESHVVSAYRLEASPACWPTLPPIGTAIANTELYVLDAFLQPVPIGIVGELYIGGRGLARGYLYRPNLSAERFIPHPFSMRPDARLYCTGDLARYLPDGAIEFIGRSDAQVKIRGYRIEPGEIEAVLRDLPGVRESAVVTYTVTDGEKRLIAYIVPEPAEVVSGQHLREALQERLPEYMVPSSFVLLAALPVTTSGKVDRHALPAPQMQDSVWEEHYEAPGTLLELQMMALWREVLHLENISVRDNFFSLGGHSLLATRLFARIRTTFGVEIPLRSIFVTPTIAPLARQVEEAQRTLAGTQLTAITQSNHKKHVPLSYAQQRLWFLTQLEPESPFYTIPVALSLNGQLNLEALERSFNEIVHRHDALRTTFALEQGLPVQIFASALTLTLPVIDLQALPQDKRSEYAMQLAEEGIRQPFDPGHGPLLRIWLLQLEKSEYILLLTLHHSITDGWSMDVFFHELRALYEAFSAGKASPLPDLPIQYADFAIWQRQWLQGALLEQHMRAWKATLAGAPALLELPTDYPRPGVQSTRGKHHAFALPCTLTQPLKTLSRQAGVTLFMLLLAAFQVLLLHYSGQEDMVIGTPIAGRSREELEELIGCFINTLVLRTDLSGNPSFRELLERVREVALHAYAHQDIPFEHLVEALQPERSLSHTPLFQVMFVWQDSSEAAWQLPGLALQPLRIESGSAKFDLTMFLWEEAECFAGTLEYSTDLFMESTIERLLAHYQRLLESVVAQPALPLASLSMFSEAEQEMLLLHWSQGKRTPLIETDLITRFVEQVVTTPDAVALVYEDVSWTYQHLSEQASRLAHHLRRAWAGPEVLVAILAERGPELVMAVLATFATGAAYLPLDPLQPGARQRQILTLSNVKLILATAAFSPLLEQMLLEFPAERRPRLLQVEPLLSQETHTQPAAIELTPAANVHALAYVIYTSGSTGQPKGAMIEQGGMLNHLTAKIDELQLTANDTVAQNASQCFDISVWQMLAVLLVGGRVQILPEEVARDPHVLLEEIGRHAVTVLETVPSLLQVLLEEGEQRAYDKPGLTMLRWLIATGEALPYQLCKRWLQLYGHVPLVNAYGPTECSDDVTHQFITEPATQMSSVPIGLPVHNIQLYVLDRWLGLAPPGAFGELYVGGRGVGRGYLYDPARTAESFIPDHLSGEAGSRLYKTGDLVRYLPDGRLEYRGRLDHQVKLRGYRIELAEIEAALSRSPLVRDVVVMVQGEAQKRLVAYVVLQQPPADNEELAKQMAEASPHKQLRRFLQEHLPDYMIPATFSFLESLPRTANGKLDRQALPVASLEGREEEDENEEPRTPIEQELRQLWIQLLQLTHVGLHDNFFELGGHSILATQLIARVRDTFHVELLLRSVFEAPTIAAMAKSIVQHQSRSETAPRDVIQRMVPDDEELLLEQIHQLSDEEMDALLEAALAEEESER